jgi:hypothetical protein
MTTAPTIVDRVVGLEREASYLNERVNNLKHAHLYLTRASEHDLAESVRKACLAADDKRIHVLRMAEALRQLD